MYVHTALHTTSWLEPVIFSRRHSWRDITHSLLWIWPKKSRWLVMWSSEIIRICTTTPWHLLLSSTFRYLQGILYIVESQIGSIKSQLIWFLVSHLANKPWAVNTNHPKNWNFITLLRLGECFWYFNYKKYNNKALNFITFKYSSQKRTKILNKKVKTIQLLKKRLEGEK